VRGFTRARGVRLVGEKREFQEERLHMWFGKLCQREKSPGNVSFLTCYPVHKIIEGGNYERCI
jgi:hypothetical protein